MLWHDHRQVRCHGMYYGYPVVVEYRDIALQGGRGGKKRDAESRIPHPAKRIFFQFFFSHVKRKMIFLNFSSHM